MYQGTIYQYNQRAEVLIPDRRGTVYYGPVNHKPLVVYRELNTDIDFFVKNNDGKPQTLHNKTYSATIVDRTSKAQVIKKNLVPVDYDTGKLVLQLTHAETFLLDAKLHDLIVTYTVADTTGSYGGTSDQNNRLNFTLEVKNGAVPQLRPSIVVTTFTLTSGDYIGPNMTGPIQNSSPSGLQTVQVNTTNYTGTYKMQATLSLQPTTSDYFDVIGQSYTVSANTAVNYHTFTGMYYWTRLVHIPAAGNAGTLDKAVYRS